MLVGVAARELIPTMTVRGALPGNSALIEAQEQERAGGARA